MKKIGCFRKEQYDWIGTIAVLQFEAKARLVPVQGKAPSEMPDFILYKVGGSGGFEVELGTGWHRSSDRQRHPYIEVIVDDPSLSRPIHAIFWEDPIHEYWYLYWDRTATGSHIAERLYVQEELKPQIGIRPIMKMTQNMMLFYPELIAT